VEAASELFWQDFIY